MAFNERKAVPVSDDEQKYSVAECLSSAVVRIRQSATGGQRDKDTKTHKTQWHFLLFFHISNIIKNSGQVVRTQVQVPTSCQVNRDSKGYQAKLQI